MVARYCWQILKFIFNKISLSNLWRKVSCDGNLNTAIYRRTVRNTSKCLLWHHNQNWLGNNKAKHCVSLRFEKCLQKASLTFSSESRGVNLSPLFRSKFWISLDCFDHRSHFNLCRWSLTHSFAPVWSAGNETKKSHNIDQKSNAKNTFYSKRDILQLYSFIHNP